MTTVLSNLLQVAQVNRTVLFLKWSFKSETPGQLLCAHVAGCSVTYSTFASPPRQTTCDLVQEPSVILTLERLDHEHSWRRFESVANVNKVITPTRYGLGVETSSRGAVWKFMSREPEGVCCVLRVCMV